MSGLNKTDRKLLEQALDVIEEAQAYTSCETFSPSMTKECAITAEAIRTRLAQPEPEPVSWAVQEGTNLHDVFLFKDEADEMCHLKGTHAKAVPLYTAPLMKEWVSLKDSEIKSLTHRDIMPWMWKLIGDITTKLKEKNAA